jgi:hypothetical protein
MLRLVGSQRRIDRQIYLRHLIVKKVVLPSSRGLRIEAQMSLVRILERSTKWVREQQDGLRQGFKRKQFGGSI